MIGNKLTNSSKDGNAVIGFKPLTGLRGSEGIRKHFRIK